MTSVLRIIDFLRVMNIKPSSFYKETGLSNGYLDKVKELGADKIERIISKYPLLNLSWLITGNGQMLNENYPRYNSEWLLTGKEPMIKGHVIKRVDNIIGIPLVSQEVAAGFGNENFSIKEEDIQACYVVPDFNGIDFMIRVKGSSMYPK